MNLGRYTLGQFVPLAVVTIDSAFTPTWTANVPVYAIYTAAGVRVLSDRLVPMDLARLVGSFALQKRLTSAFTTGQYLAIVDWTLGSVAYRECNRFEVVGGGDADGALVSAHHYRRPHADFVVGRLDSDRRLLARNPEE